MNPEGARLRVARQATRSWQAFRRKGHSMRFSGGYIGHFGMLKCRLNSLICLETRAREAPAHFFFFPQILSSQQE